MEVLHQFLKSFVLSICCLTAPFQDTYVIEIPKSVDLNETSAFEVRIKENGLNENQILHIDMPSDFFLYGSDGQQSVQGSVSNNSLSYRKDEYDTKTVGLEISELAIGNGAGPCRSASPSKIPSLPTSWNAAKNSTHSCSFMILQGSFSPMRSKGHISVTFPKQKMSLSKPI